MTPSVLITGGTKGLGHEILNYFAPQSVSVSRANGFDIGTAAARAQIVQMSLEKDIFINHAHNGHFAGQTQLLYDVFEAWSRENKKGYIFNTGSFATTLPQGSFKRYSVIKHALDIANAQCCKKIENGLCSFRMTLLRPGMLDTPESRQKEHWRGNGVRGLDLAQVIEFLYKTPQDFLVSEFSVSAILPVDGGADGTVIK